ncbi:MAG: MotA/TolQ/ExbB proton channel family protein [Bacteroidota bacterium]|nr:MotA/TolQ/ExbB proton channel family protein [Bacteroidota bacterium]
MKKEESTSGFSAMFAFIVVPVAFIVGILTYVYVLGNPHNFQGGDIEKEPVKDGIEHWFGVIHKGGLIVPILLSLLLTVIIFTVERFVTIIKATGSQNINVFSRNIKNKLDTGDVQGAMLACDKQKGSIANVARAGLAKYKEMSENHELAKDQKVLAIQKEFEEATTLELPMLEKNLVVLSTISSVATLVGLLGTVIGMIKAFSAMANAGAPDASALSTGISEALINTALGIGTSILAIVFYNMFTTRIDKLTYGIDESGYSITQTFAAKHS